MTTLRQYKCDSRRIATQLRYDRVDPDIFRKITQAATFGEVTRAMITARHMYNH